MDFEHRIHGYGNSEIRHIRGYSHEQIYGPFDVGSMVLDAFATHRFRGRGDNELTDKEYVAQLQSLQGNLTDTDPVLEQLLENEQQQTPSDDLGGLYVITRNKLKGIHFFAGRPTLDYIRAFVNVSQGGSEDKNRYTVGFFPTQEAHTVWTDPRVAERYDSLIGFAVARSLHLELGFDREALQPLWIQSAHEEPLFEPFNYTQERLALSQQRELEILSDEGISAPTRTVAQTALEAFFAAEQARANE